MSHSKPPIYREKSNKGKSAKSIEMSGELSLSSQHSKNNRVELSGELSFLDDGASHHSTKTWSHRLNSNEANSVTSNRSNRTWGGSMLGAIDKFNEKSELSIRSNRTWTIAGKEKEISSSTRSHRTHGSAASNRSNRSISREQQEAYYDDVSLLEDKASNRSSRTASIRNRTMEAGGKSDKSLTKTETSCSSVSHFYGNGVTVSGGPADENFMDEFGNKCSRYVNRTIVINDHMASYAATRSIQDGNESDESLSSSSRKKRSQALSFRYRATLFFFVASTLILLLLLCLDVGRKNGREVMSIDKQYTSNSDYYNHIAEAVQQQQQQQQQQTNTGDDFFDEFAQELNKGPHMQDEFETKTARLFEPND